MSTSISNKVKVPKGCLIDLHCHLDGSITLEIAKKLAKLQNIELPAVNDEELKEMLSVPDTCTSLNEFLKCFNLPVKLMQTKEGIEESVYLVQENIRKQGVIYLEIRFAPQLHCGKGLNQTEVVEAALKGLKKSDLHTNLILCLMRGNNNKKENYETIKVAQEFLVKDGGVVGLDIAGAEALFPTKDFEKEFGLIRKNKIPFTIHAGEADGPQSIKDALSFGAVRIGHGVRAYEDQELIDKIKDKNIILELAPTSNLITKAIKNEEEFPIVDFLKKGIKVTINTDDMAICRTTLIKEFEFVIRHYALTQENVKQLLINSAEAAFTSEETKETLKKIIIQES